MLSLGLHHKSSNREWRPPNKSYRWSSNFKSDPNQFCAALVWSIFEQLLIGRKRDILTDLLTMTANEAARMSPSLYDIAKLHLTAPMDFCRNFIPLEFLGPYRLLRISRGACSIRLKTFSLPSKAFFTNRQTDSHASLLKDMWQKLAILENDQPDPFWP